MAKRFDIAACTSTPSTAMYITSSHGYHMPDFDAESRRNLGYLSRQGSAQNANLAASASRPRTLMNSAESHSLVEHMESNTNYLSMSDDNRVTQPAYNHSMTAGANVMGGANWSGMASPPFSQALTSAAMDTSMPMTASPEMAMLSTHMSVGTPMDVSADVCSPQSFKFLSPTHSRGSRSISPQDAAAAMGMSNMTNMQSSTGDLLMFQTDYGGSPIASQVSQPGQLAPMMPMSSMSTMGTGQAPTLPSLSYPAMHHGAGYSHVSGPHGIQRHANAHAHAHTHALAHGQPSYVVDHGSGNNNSISSNNNNNNQSEHQRTKPFSCTYTPCPERFDTMAQLQTHKREIHRGSNSNPEMTQRGPFICMLINDNTGRPCDSQFNRPYDLTRHEATIHNGKNLKVYCDICPDRSFSRFDALTRHYAHTHPSLTPPVRDRANRSRSQRAGRAANRRAQRASQDLSGGGAASHGHGQGQGHGHSHSHSHGQSGNGPSDTETDFYSTLRPTS